MSGKPYYITTPIYFSSGKLHIGHAYSTVAADAAARLKRAQGYDVMFLTGTDEHGQKIERRALEAGVPPKQYVDEIAAGVRELWALMNVSYDKFIRTTDAEHELAVQRIFKKLFDQDDIYKSSYEGLYCTECESFWTKTQAEGGCCPDCGRAVETAVEESYFFRLSKYANRLVEFYETHPDFLQPASRVNEMMNNFIKPGLADISVSRTSFKWGVPVDFDPAHVVYVWLDALTNYISALGYGTGDESLMNKFWPADVHLMAKEIVRFHAVIWPCVLFALDLELPKKVIGHGWLLIDGDKMSKSRGNVIDPVVLCGRYGVDAIRYFLLREMPFGNDASFTNEALIARINSDLANDLGNLLSRTVAMVEKYFGGTLPASRESAPIDDEISKLAAETAAAYTGHMERMCYSDALAEVWRLIGRSNKYIDETAPWILAKDEANAPRLGAVLRTLCEALRVVAVLIMPAMPGTSAEILRQLGREADIGDWDSAAAWQLSGDYTVARGAVMFPRLDPAAELEALRGESPAPESAPESGGQHHHCGQHGKPHQCCKGGGHPENAAKLPQDAAKTAKLPDGTPSPDATGSNGIASLATIDDFAKIELRAATVLECVPVEKSDKLLRLMVDAGEDQPRQVVSGIAAWYKPEELVGRGVILVSNLKPAKLRGVMSCGMILAADNSEDDVRVIFADGLKPGAKVR